MIFIKTIAIDGVDQRAQEIYGRFAARSGAEHIASPIGLHALLAVVDKTKPKYILEVGGGIGTLSYALLTYSEARIDVFEDHPFCIDQLRKALVRYEDRYTLLDTYERYALPRTAYDVVIIDGGGHAFIYNLIRELDDVRVIFIEGGRREQRKQARRALRHRYVFKPVRYRDLHKKYKGAHAIFCKRSNNALLRLANYWFWEILIFEEIRSSFLFRAKRLLFK